MINPTLKDYEILWLSFALALWTQLSIALNFILPLGWGSSGEVIFRDINTEEYWRGIYFFSSLSFLLLIIFLIRRFLKLDIKAEIKEKSKPISIPIDRKKEALKNKKWWWK